MYCVRTTDKLDIFFLFVKKKNLQKLFDPLPVHRPYRSGIKAKKYPDPS